ncbi:B3/B4 domain-containing protein [Clostridioides difficile]
MIDISIDKKLKDKWPDAKLGCIQAKVVVNKSSEKLIKGINELCDILNQKLEIEDITKLDKIKDARDAYKELGKNPSRYRTSSEALVRRIVQGKGLYTINNIVEINNLISIKSLYPVGTYNVSKLHPPICFTVGDEGEQYKGIGKELINIENLPILSDSLGKFGSPTSDSERAMITTDANEILICIFSFSPESDIEEYFEYAKDLLKEYADGKEIETKIIK